MPGNTQPENETDILNMTHAEYVQYLTRSGGPRPAPNPARSFCDNCGGHAGVGAVTIPARGAARYATWCSRCFARFGATCQLCAGPFYLSYGYSVRCPQRGTWESQIVCRDCYERMTPCRCPQCCNTYSERAALVYSPDQSHDICRICSGSAADPDRDRVVIHNYSYKPTPIFHGSGRQYGVELEVEMPSGYEEEYGRLVLGQLGRKAAYLKLDGSVKGFEIVTYPHDLAAHRELWSKFKSPAEMTSHLSGHCGIHVHIQRKGLSALQTGKMLVFVNSTGNAAFIRTVAQRDSSGYNLRRPKKITDVSEPLPEGRHAALNLTNRNTIELRIFRGNTRPERVLKAVEFADALVAFTAGQSHRALTAQEFIRFLLAAPKDTWPALTAYLTEKGLVSVCDVCGGRRSNLPPVRPAAIDIGGTLHHVCAACQSRPARAIRTVALGKDAITRRGTALAAVADN